MTRKIRIRRHDQLECNYCIKNECPLNGNCQKEDVTLQPRKVYFGLTEGEFKKPRYYNHTQSFRNENYLNSTTLSSFIWKMKKKKKKTPRLGGEIIQTAAPCTNITKRCSLCFYEKLAILLYLNQTEILNKRSWLVSNCRYENEFLWQMSNSND